MAELQPRGNCAYEVDGKVLLKRSALSELSFSHGALANVYTRQFGWLFVKRDGTTVRTVTFDNGPDIFSENLARYVDGGKIGFIDTSGTITIQAQFGFASPFLNGRSMVCNEFVMERVGEHGLVKSSRWGCIGKNGEILLPMRYSEQEMRTKLKSLPMTNNALQRPAAAVTLAGQSHSLG